MQKSPPSTKQKMSAPIIPPLAAEPNPYNTPVKVIIDKYIYQENGAVQLIQEIEEKNFTDLQEAWIWCRNQTGVYDFPESQSEEGCHGEHADWEFMSFFFVRNQLAIHPEDEFEIFFREDDEGQEWSYTVRYEADLEVEPGENE